MLGRFAKKTRQEKMDETIERLNNGITDFFTSEKPESYKEYLKVMSRFHHYSANNCALIAAQYPGATKVAGYKAWQKKFDRHVNRGETGITIFAAGTGVRDVDTGKVDENGNKIIEKRKYTYFFPTTVFDVEQTSGAELPLAIPRLDFEVKDYDRIMSVLSEMAGKDGINIFIEEMGGSKSGFYSLTDNSIHVKAGMSNAQTIKTLIHEMAHSRLHNKVIQAENKTTTEEKEVEAESTAFIVCDHMGIDTSDYSFGYVSGWSDGKTLDELKTCAENIRKTATGMIDELDKKLGLVTGAETDEFAEKVTEAAQVVLNDSFPDTLVTGTVIYGEKKLPADENLKILFFNESQSFTARVDANGTRDRISDAISRMSFIDNSSLGGGYSDYDGDRKRAVCIIRSLQDKGFDASINEPAMSDVRFDMGYNITTGKIYSYTEPLNNRSIRAVISIQSSIDEGEIFKVLNGSDISIDGKRVEINTVMAEKISDWSEHYVERLDVYEKKGLDARWPMVTIAYTNVEEIEMGSMNIGQAVKLFNKLDSSIVNDSAKYMNLKIAYVYNDWQYETVQNIDFGKGRKNFIEYLNLPDKTIRHLKAHNELLKMCDMARDFSPGTIYGERYADDMQMWSEYCRMEINHNSDKPVIPRPPEIDAYYQVMNNDWSLENGG